MGEQKDDAFEWTVTTDSTTSSSTTGMWTADTGTHSTVHFDVEPSASWANEMKDQPAIDPEEEEEEKIDEETQKEVDKIGTPGQRGIDDLLKAFKVIKNPGLDKSAVQELADKTWSDEVMREDSVSPDEEPVAPPSSSLGT